MMEIAIAFILPVILCIWEVLEQTIDSIEVTAPGSPKTILQLGTLQFSAKVTGTGEPDLSVSWSLDNKVDGVSGNTVIEVQATSTEDEDRNDSITITVSDTTDKIFSIDDTTITYWQDFNTFPDAGHDYITDGTFNVYNTELNRSYFKQHSSAKNRRTGRVSYISSVLNYPITPISSSTLQYKSVGFSGCGSGGC